MIGLFISPLERRAMIGSLIPGKWDSKRWQLICHRRTQKPFTNQTPFQQLKTFPSAPLSLFLSLSLFLTRIIKFIIISASVEPWIISHDRFQQGAAARNKGQIRGERKREDFETDTQAPVVTFDWVLLCLRVNLHIIWHMQVAQSCKSVDLSRHFLYIDYFWGKPVGFCCRVALLLVSENI